MPSLFVRIDGKPTAKGRPRVFRNGGVKTPTATVHYEALVQYAVQQAMAEHDGPFPLARDVAVTVRIAAVWKRVGRFRKIDPTYRIPRTKQPDADNVVKSILDGINNAGFWGDDAQVHSVTLTKWEGQILGDRREKRSEAPHVDLTLHW